MPGDPHVPDGANTERMLQRGKETRLHIGQHSGLRQSQREFCYEHGQTGLPAHTRGLLDPQEHHVRVSGLPPLMGSGHQATEFQK